MAEQTESYATDRMLLAASDVAASVEAWAAAQSGAIVDAGHGPVARELWEAGRRHFENQRARIICALLESDRPMEWETYGANENNIVPIVDPEIVGETLVALVEAARDVALSLGWQPRRRSIPARTRTLIYRRDGYACVECGQDDVHKLTVDHRIAVHLGGGNDPDNLITRCRNCNSAKGASVR